MTAPTTKPAMTELIDIPPHIVIAKIIPPKTLQGSLIKI